MGASGALPLHEIPGFDDDYGVLANAEEAEETVEIEMNPDEPLFLRGQTRQSVNLSPVR